MGMSEYFEVVYINREGGGNEGAIRCETIKVAYKLMTKAALRRRGCNTAFLNAYDDEADTEREVEMLDID